MHRRIGWLLAILSWVNCFWLTPGPSAAHVISFPNFSSTAGLNLVEDSYATTGYGGNTVLSLTPAAVGQKWHCGRSENRFTFW
jgi:hypothetical protein